MEDDAYGGPVEGVAEISIAKNRNGATKDVKLKFVARFAKFMDLEIDYSSLNTISPSASFDSPGRTRTVMSKMNDDDRNDTAF
jgi:replicative DNA helicase